MNTMVNRNSLGSKIGDVILLPVVTGGFAPQVVDRDYLNLPAGKSQRIYMLVGNTAPLKTGDMLKAEIVGAEITDEVNNGATVILVDVKVVGRELHNRYTYNKAMGTVSRFSYCGQNFVRKEEVRNAVTRASLGKYGSGLMIDILWDNLVVATVESKFGDGRQGAFGRKLESAMHGKSLSVSVGSRTAGISFSA